MSERLIWIPANGPSITFDREGPYVLMPSLQGLGTTMSNPVLSSAPGQHGATAIDVEVTPRVISFPILVKGNNREHWRALRSTLSRSLTALPQRTAQKPPLGILRYERPGSPTREIEAVPRNSPIDGGMGVAWNHADLEFDCPRTFWRDLEESQLEIIPDSVGFEFPLEHPFEILGGSTQVDVDNIGDVDAPVMLRVYGELTTPRLINLTTGQSIEITGQVNNDQFIEIRTGFGDKAVELVQPTGVRENWMSNINLEDSDFWWLRPGLNVIRLEADSNITGNARVYWRNRWAGI